MLATVTMLPRSPSRGSCSSIWVTACLQTRKVPVRLTSITRCHSSRSSRWTEPPPATPAAWNTPSSRPPPRDVGFLHDGGDGVLVAHVDAAEVRQVGGCGEVGAEDGRALGHQALGGGAADAGRSPGDQHGSVLKG